MTDQSETDTTTTNENGNSPSSAAMESYEAWKRRLRPFAEKYAELEQEMQEMMEEKTEEEVRSIYQATKKPEETNCSRAMYASREWVREIAKRVLVDKTDL